jgi:hypothetical protein
MALVKISQMVAIQIASFEGNDEASRNRFSKIQHISLPYSFRKAVGNK